MANSDRKGKAGERELCRKLRKHGFGAIRSAQVTGAKDHSHSADIITSIELVRFEVKRGYEDVSITSKKFDQWIEKAREETPDEIRPILAWRKNRQPWVFFDPSQGPGLHVLRGMATFYTHLVKLFGSYAVDGFKVDDPETWKTTDTFS